MSSGHAGPDVGLPPARGHVGVLAEDQQGMLDASGFRTQDRPAANDGKPGSGTFVPRDARKTHESKGHR